MLSITRTFALLIVLLAAVGSPALCQREIPPDSLIKLQDIFTQVRDEMWKHNDNYWHRGEFDRCIATMRLITEIDPSDTEAYDGGAWLMDSDLRDAEAEAFFLEGLSHNPDVYDLYYALGNFYYYREQFDLAIEYLSGAVTFSTPEFVWHQLAHAYEHAGSPGESLSTWLEIEALEPGNPIPTKQVERLLEGGEMSRVPEMVSRSRQQRKLERSKKSIYMSPSQ